jgi:alginate O-acetyltransferase complex protein AlgJ
MAAVARRLAGFLKEHVELPQRGSAGVQTEAVAVSNRGDLAAMLELPAGPGRFGPETVQVEQVVGDGDLLWRLDTSADVLLLGDSFTNVFSLPTMGWAEAGGLAEHLSLELDRPIDAITRNDSGAWATRALLAQELARGRDRLRAKRVVVWEFAARELSLGDWRHVPLELGTAKSEGFFAPAPGSSVAVTGTITAMGVVPRPRSAPYADFIVALHLEDLAGETEGVAPGQALVFVLAMKEYELTPAAFFRVGQRVRLKLRRWSDVAAQYDLINRGELYEGGLMMQEPCWGEEVGP